MEKFSYEENGYNRHEVSACIFYVVSEEIGEYRLVADCASDLYPAVAGCKQPSVALGPEIAEAAAQVKSKGTKYAGLAYIRNGLGEYDKF